MFVTEMQALVKKLQISLGKNVKKYYFFQCDV